MIRTGTPDDLAAIRRLLAGAGLPSDDLAGAAPATLFVAESGGGLIGAGALEQHGRHGLLRSVVVDAPSRSNGVGARLVNALAAAATERGLTDLWLLTETASRYFARFGFDVADRELAPPEIQASGQFADVCSDTAVLMHRPAPSSSP